MPDSLTIAYIAIGASRRLTAAIKDEADAHARLIDGMCGEVGVIAHLVSFSDQLDALQDAIGGDAYIYAYDVCEEFGFRAAGRMLDTAFPTMVNLEEVARLTIAAAKA